jgi:general secretion pathway protein D
VNKYRHPVLVGILGVSLLLGACATNPAIGEANQLAAEGRSEEGVQRLEQAMRMAPDDRELRAQYFRKRDDLVQQWLVQAQLEQQGRRPAQARALFEGVMRLDANNLRARSGLADLQVGVRHEGALRDARAALDKGDLPTAERLVRAVLLENPGQDEAREILQRTRDLAVRPAPPASALSSPFSKPITLEFKDTPLRSVFEVISRSAGINFVFDRDVRADTRVTIFMRNTAVDDVVKLILVTNQLERKMLNDNSVLIYPNTPAKVREYQELVTRSFYLANTDVKQAQAMVRTLVKTRDIFADEKLNLLVIKDTADAVRLAERLIESLDMAEPEVMLDVEVLEMTRGKLQELGLRFPDQVGYGLLQPTTNSTIVNNGVTQTNTTLGGTIAPGFVDLRNRGGLTSFVTNPAVTLNLRNEAGQGNLLANPRIRVRNREKAKIHIGDRLPVFTSTSTANVGISSTVTYLDVGLKLEVEPNVYLDGEVAIKIGLEVSSVAREIPGPGNSLAYQVGTRSAATVLRLRNGETQVLAGLISDEERSSANRIPGLGEIPLLGRLFTNQRDNNSKTEIVLLITPRIVRNVSRPAAESVTVPAGSESSVGAPAFRLPRTELRGLSMSSSPVGGAAAAPPAVPAAVPRETPPDPVAPADAAAAPPPAAPAASGTLGTAAQGAPAAASQAPAPVVAPVGPNPINVSPPGLRP